MVLQEIINIRSMTILFYFRHPQNMTSYPPGSDTMMTMRKNVCVSAKECTEKKCSEKIMQRWWQQKDDKTTKGRTQHHEVSNDFSDESHIIYFFSVLCIWFSNCCCDKMAIPSLMRYWHLIVITIKSVQSVEKIPILY